MTPLRQVTLAFDTPVNAETIAAILRRFIRDKDIVVGKGAIDNGIPLGWIVVHDKENKVE